MVQAGAAVLFGDGGPQHAELAELVHDLAVEYFVTVGLEHARHEAVLTIIMARIADHALVFGELCVEQQRIGPGEIFHDEAPFVRSISMATPCPMPIHRLIRA